MQNRTAVFIVGPTGVGKTAGSIEIAKLLGTEIISADSMQIYKYMDIGTAKVTPDEADGVIHHMTDIVSPLENYSVCDYVKAARSAAEDIQNRGLVPLIVGGTGLYVDALTGRLSFDDDASSDLQYRSELNALCEERGAEFVHNVLKNVDKASADAIHPNNIKRVIRALEYYHVTGQTISAHNEETKNKEPLYLTSKIGFTRSRENLYARIDKRVDIMLKQGLLDETRRLLDMGCTDANTSMQALGYREAAQYLKGGMSYDEMAELIKRNSRRYAKRQLTWFKRDEEIHWLNLDETYGEKLAQICIDIINKDLKRSTR